MYFELSGLRARTTGRHEPSTWCIFSETTLSHAEDSKPIVLWRDDAGSCSHAKSTPWHPLYTLCQFSYALGRSHAASGNFGGRGRASVLDKKGTRWHQSWWTWRLKVRRSWVERSRTYIASLTYSMSSLSLLLSRQRHAHHNRLD
jgi:hypothetical protein